MSPYQSSGDLILIPQHTPISKPDEPVVMHGNVYFDTIKMTDKNQTGVIVDRFDTPIGVMYQVLIEGQYWCLSANDVSWTGV
jgi:hypothetical protein